ncbi:hypothetical protein BOX15_Mlig024126g1, partial [Macrostomum lignano]
CCIYLAVLINSSNTAMSSCSILYPPGCKEIHESLKPDELKKRLKELWGALTMLVSLDKQGNNNNDFQGLSLHLAASHFLNHPDKDIRLLVGCCLIELFKIYCPSNPFVSLCDEDQLIVTVVVFLFKTASRMQQIQSKEDVAYQNLSYFCQSLIQTDFISVCHTNPDGKRACFEFFRFLFTIVRTVDIWSWEDTPDDCVRYLLDAAVKVVDEEMELLGPDTVKYVLEFIIQPKKMQEPRCYQLASRLLRETVKHLDQMIHQMLQNMLVLSSEDSDEQPQLKSQQSGIRDELVFSLIYELHKIDHVFVSPVLPMLELKLLSNHERERKRACRLMAKLFSETTGNLVQLQPDLWKAFLGRFVDVSLEVRRICVASVPQLLRTNPDLRDTLVALLRGRSIDAHTDIRDCVIGQVVELAKQELESLPEDYLSILIDRSRDKDQGVRRAALTSLASIYKTYSMNADLIKSGNKTVWSRLSQCVNAIMHMYFQESNWDRIAVERHFKASLVPYSLGSKDRMRALLRCFCSFSNPSTKALVEMLKTQYHVTQLTSAILEIISAEPDKLSPESESVIMAKLRSLSIYFQHAERANEYLRKFFNFLHREKPMRQLLTKILSKDCPCDKAAELLRSLLASHDQALHIGKKAKETENAINYRITVKTLLERVGPVLFDRESVTSLVNLLISGREDPANILPGEACEVTQHKGLLLLNMLSFYLRHTVDLDDTFDYVVECLGDESMEMDTAEVCLRLLLNLTPLFTEDRQEAIDAVVPRLRRICDVAKTSASCSSLAKVAAKCLTALQATELAPQIAGELDSLVADAVKISSGSELCVPRLDALGQILKQSALKYQSKVANLVAKRLPEFVRQAPSSSAGGAAAAGSRSKSTAASSARDLSRWSPTESLSHLAQVKLASIRCLCHYLIGLASASAASSSAAADCTSDTAQSIVDLFHQIILYDGNPSSSSSGKGAKLEAGEMAQMRVCAAKALLRVCKRQALVPLLDCERFQTLALTVCDPCKEVRHAVLGKLHRGLVKFKLPLQFMAMFAYVPEAAEDKELLQTARTYYSRCVAARREYLASKQSVIANDRVTFFAVLPDYTLPYAVHLLANDPEFESPKDAKQLARLKSGLRFLLEPLIAKGENFGFLRRMLETMRLARDAQRPDDELANKKLHAVCDLALGLIVTKSTNFSISNYPIEPQLPKRLFLLPANREATVAAEFASLPAGVQFSPPKNPAAIQQGLIPKDRVRLGKRAAAAAATTNSANLSNISTMAKSPPSAPAAKSTPAVQVSLSANRSTSSTSTKPLSQQSKRDEQQPSTVAKNPPAKSPIKSPLKSATTSTESPVASATSAATKKKQAQQRGAAASQNGRSAAVQAGKIKKAAATKTATKTRPSATKTITKSSSPSPTPSPSPSPSPSPVGRRRGAKSRPISKAAASKAVVPKAANTKAAASKTAASKAATSKATVISRKRRAVAMVSPTDESSAASQEASSPAPSPSPKKRRRGLAVAVASPSTLSTTPTPGSGSGSGVSSGRLSRAAKSRSIEALSRRN